MKPAPYNLILQTASRDNILTLTTSCSTSCIFCSHHQNHEDIEAYYVKDLELEKVTALFTFLDKDRKIIIGESATRICEGEPFSHPQIMEILKALRQQFPKTIVQITTSAVPLREEMLPVLKSLGGIELNVSLNSSTEEGRAKLFKGKSLMEAVKITEYLKRYGIPFNGSVVAMPHVVGYEDIEKTVQFLSSARAETIRVYKPGYTRFTQMDIPPVELETELAQMIARLRERIKTPILLEPMMLHDLTAQVEGVIKGSPASKAGMETGDIVISIDNQSVFSRVDAYHKLIKHQNPHILYLRNGEVKRTGLKKARNAASGLVFQYDIHPDTITDINRAVRRNRGKRIHILTSQMAYPLISKSVAQNEQLKVEAAENTYFGGNIRCAGLLLVSDILLHLENMPERPQALILPSIMFDTAGKDLAGVHFMHIREKMDIHVEVI